jgi:hypothetical protein
MKPILLVLISAVALSCSGSRPSVPGTASRSDNSRVVNLKRAAELPWVDEGRCAVQEAANPWAVLVERCFHALDSRRIQFRDPERRCAVASTDAAAMGSLLGVCILSAPPLGLQVAIGAVVIIGVVVAAAAIAEALDDEYALRRQGPSETERGRPATQAGPATKREPNPEQRPPAGPFPPGLEDEDDPKLDAWVVRAGVATPKQLQNGVAEHNKVAGLTGFSVQSAPGKTVEELAAAGDFKTYGQISVTTVRALMKIGVPVVPSPGKGYHNTAVTPLPLSETLAAMISAAFQPRPNPVRAR